MRAVVINDSVRIAPRELVFRFARSSGPGGQNVNKVSSRVELCFDVRNSPSLTSEQKLKLLTRLRTRIDKEGKLHLVSQESRSQWKNRELAVEKFATLLRFALTPEQKRIPTKATSRASARRVKAKKIQSAKKLLRRRVGSVEE